MLFFVNILGKHDAHSLERIINLSSPIIEDDGHISSLYNAKPNDVVIIGRDFRIKFKHSRPDNSTIYNQVMRYAYESSSPPTHLSDHELATLMKNIAYYCIKDNQIHDLAETLKGKKSIVNLFISACSGCPDNRRVQLLKEISQKKFIEDTNIIILFAEGNSIGIARNFYERMELENYPIAVGVIKTNHFLPYQEYLKIFQFDVDPRTFIFNENGNLVYKERLGDERMMDTEYLLRKIK